MQAENAKERRMLIPLLLLAGPARPAAASWVGDPPVRVWFNEDGRYAYGDKARVYVQTAADGYVVVLRSDARGNVRLLSPLDPDGDQRVSAGKKYEAKGRGGREAFVVEDTAGQGLVLAAWSSTPFELRRFEQNGHWDPEALADSTGGLSTIPDDPEARLLTVVDAMRSGGHYKYDAEPYVVFAPRVARAVYPYPYPYGWGGYWGYDPWWPGPVFGGRVVIVPRRFGFGPRGFGFGRRW
jgi:Domain of unknown function (DUF4384)